MTRIPDSPLADHDQQSADTLARYLVKLSESRQVMMMRCLRKNSIRLAVEHRLAELKKSRKKGW